MLWLAGAWVDIITLLVIIILSIIYWLIYTYSFSNNGITVNYGAILRKKLYIPFDNITTISVIETFWLKPVNAAVFRADTIAGSARSADFAVILGKNRAITYLKKHGTKSKNYLCREYKPKQKYIFAMSLIMSNSFAGIILISTFITQAGKLLGQEFEDKIYGTFENISKVMAFGVPPAAAAATYIILFGWLISFALNMIRHKNFSVRRIENIIKVHSGVLTNRNYSIKFDDISYIDIRQSVLTKILGLHSVFASAVGFGKMRGDISTIVPTARLDELEQNLRLLMPEYNRHSRKLKHSKGALLKFINYPLIYCILIQTAIFLLTRYFKEWRELIYYVGLMCSIPAYWFLIVRIWDYISSGLAKHNCCFTLYYSSGFYLHTVVIQQDKIAKVYMRQSIFQRFDNTCDVLIYSSGEKKNIHRIRSLKLEECKKIFI